MKPRSLDAFILVALLFAVRSFVEAQVGISNDNSMPDNSAMLDVKSTTKGFLPPRLTDAQILAIENPAAGLIVYSTSVNSLVYFNGTVWKRTDGQFYCGQSSLTIIHVAGDVAPVDKTVNYGTVTNIPGEPSKCWITSNLGADHQAAAKDDASEASAGWYWQFNRKQGYKHDGAVRTPNTAWITFISENSDWLQANDPCTIELGVEWRIPTLTEWVNVTNGGGWTDWNGPWNSGLKMHAAGALYSNTGILYNRGYYAYYWSITQYNNTDAWDMQFSESLSWPAGNFKASGDPVRCITE